MHFPVCFTYDWIVWALTGFYLADFNSRLEKLMKYVTSAETVQNSTRWLARVKLHMSSEAMPAATADDREYLSRFHFTRNCGGDIDEWDEWSPPYTSLDATDTFLLPLLFLFFFLKGLNQSRSPLVTLLALHAVRIPLESHTVNTSPRRCPARVGRT